MPPPIETSLSDAQAHRYLTRLGIERHELATDADGLRRLHLAHLEQVPFENLDIVFAGGVRHDRIRAVDKLVGSRRGGWCFEVNGALSLLLEWLGFDVKMLGAAVLLDGPSSVIEHLLLEVAAPGLSPRLVDVGFGASFDVPLVLNTNRPQEGDSGTFELLPSPRGTTLARLEDGVPAALLRFKRVAHAFDDFAAVAQSMQRDQAKSWSSKPFATRRLPADGTDGAPGRVTLTNRLLTIRRGDVERQEPVTDDAWHGALVEWFGISSVRRERSEQR